MKNFSRNSFLNNENKNENKKYLKSIGQLAQSENTINELPHKISITSIPSSIFLNFHGLFAPIIHHLLFQISQGLDKLFCYISETITAGFCLKSSEKSIQ